MPIQLRSLPPSSKPEQLGGLSSCLWSSEASFIVLVDSICRNGWGSAPKENVTNYWKAHKVMSNTKWQLKMSKIAIAIPIISQFLHWKFSAIMNDTGMTLWPRTWWRPRSASPSGPSLPSSCSAQSETLLDADLIWLILKEQSQINLTLRYWHTMCLQGPSDSWAGQSLLEADPSCKGKGDLLHSVWRGSLNWLLSAYQFNWKQELELLFFFSNLMKNKEF